MNFMSNTDFLLLMAHNVPRTTDTNSEREYVLTVEDRKRLRDVGIQTVSEQPAWCVVEPSKGAYNFTYLDDLISRNRQAGLKTIFSICGWRLPYWIPNEWRARREDGIYEVEMLSLWNEEAQEYSDRYYRLLYDKYDDPDVMFIFSEYQGGEGALPPTSCFYDWAALDSYRDRFGSSATPALNDPDTMWWLGGQIIRHFVRKSKILYSRYKEVWNMQQFLMDKWTKAFGNFVQTDILKAYRKLFPDGNVVLLQYTYYDDSHGEDNVQHVDMLRDISGCEVIVEAMFCKGLSITTPKAIAKGFRGQIIRPVHEPGATKLEDWMVENIRASYNQWMESKKE